MSGGEVEVGPVNRALVEAVKQRHNQATARRLLSVTPELVALLIAQQGVIDWLAELVDEDYEGIEGQTRMRSQVQYMLGQEEEALAVVVEESLGIAAPTGAAKEGK